MIHIKNLKKYYGKRQVLDIEDLVLEDGRCYCILGENGSGKSTFLRILAGVIMPDEGTIEGLEQMNQGYLPQNPYVFDLSVENNIKLGVKESNGLWKNRETRKEIQKKTDFILNQVNLTHLAKSRAKQLSGGEAQRMAFARVIARKHRMVLLDEPTSSTDIVGIAAIEQALKQYHKETHSLIILVTHLPVQAMRLADEIIFLQKGKVIERGETNKVLKLLEHQSVKLFLEHWKM